MTTTISDMSAAIQVAQTELTTLMASGKQGTMTPELQQALTLLTELGGRLQGATTQQRNFNQAQDEEAASTKRAADAFKK